MNVYSALDNCQHVACRQDLQFFAVVLDFGATVTAEDHVVADLDVQGDAVAVVVNASGAHCQNFTFLRLFLSGIGNVQTGSGLLFAVNLTDDNTVDLDPPFCHRE